jgi:hypothetical protein
MYEINAAETHPTKQVIIAINRGVEVATRLV